MIFRKKILKIYFEKKYPFLGKISSLKEIAHNDINSQNFVVTTKKGKFTIRKFKDNSKPKRIEEICNILDKCVKKGIKVIQPIKNVDGKYVDSKNKIFLTKFYEGIIFNGSTIQIKDLGKQIALLHKQLQKEKKYRIKPRKGKYKILNTNEIGKILKIIQMKKKKDIYDKKIEKDIKMINNAVLINNKFQKKIISIKKSEQLIHHDLHPKNILFIKNKIIVFLDFNSLRLGQKNGRYFFCWI